MKRSEMEDGFLFFLAVLALATVLLGVTLYGVYGVALYFVKGDAAKSPLDAVKLSEPQHLGPLEVYEDHERNVVCYVNGQYRAVSCVVLTPKEQAAHDAAGGGK